MSLRLATYGIEVERELLQRNIAAQHGRYADSARPMKLKPFRWTIIVPRRYIALHQFLPHLDAVPNLAAKKL